MDIGLSVEVAQRVTLAVAMGAAIGLQREIDDQPAGLRTHLAVSLGAALFGVISTLGFSEFEQPRADSNFQVDVTRVASQVVVGIGFLGAGVIFRRGADVKNLTTAATLWATAAIGLAAGVGDGGTAVFSAVLLVFVLAVLRIPRDWVRRRFTRTTRVALVRVARAGEDAAHVVRRAIDDLEDAEVTVLGAEKHDGQVVYRVRIVSDPSASPEACIETLVERPDIDDIRFVDEVRDD